MSIYLNVSNTFLTRANTGIQRVVRELGGRLAHNHGCTLFVFNKGAFGILNTQQDLPLLLAGKTFTPAKQVTIEHFQSGDIILDLDASWWDSYSCTDLWKALKKRQCLLVKMHYDAVPLLFPTLAHPDTRWRFLENFSAAARYMDYWVCNTRTVANDLDILFSKARLGGAIHSVCGLGADLPAQVEIQKPKLNLPKRFLLAVGTIEPRKNHNFVLDIFEHLTAQSEHANLGLVLVGKSGWNNESVLARIKAHSSFKKTLFWLDTASDGELAWLYQHTHLCLCLSHYEGFGLPAIEALAHGAPALCTAGSAMEEVTGNHANSVVLELEPAVTAATKLLSDAGRTTALKNLTNFPLPTWDQAAQQLSNTLSTIGDKNDFSRPARQAAYISVRPIKLLRSLQSVAHHMPFIKKVVVLTSDAHYAAIAALANKVALPLTVLRESDLNLNKLPADHAERNTLLRHRLYQQDDIEDNFIALDDDCVVVAPVEPTHFQQDNQHIAYWFFEDGQRWLGALHAPTSFDISLWKTSTFLKEAGFPTRLYNAHQPQIINKRLALEVFRRTQGLGCDEWSCYFNMGKLLRPNGFMEMPYMCAGWPALREGWLPDVSPSQILFYNDPDYRDSLNTQITEWHNEIKLALNQRASTHPNLPDLIVTPTTVSFNPTAITCSPGVRLNILIVTAIDSFALRYHFAGVNVDCGLHIPNFIPITVPHEHNTQWELRVEITYKTQKYMTALIISTR